MVSGKVSAADAEHDERFLVAHDQRIRVDSIESSDAEFGGKRPAYKIVGHHPGSTQLAHKTHPVQPRPLGDLQGSSGGQAEPVKQRRQALHLTCRIKIHPSLTCRSESIGQDNRLSRPTTQQAELPQAP